MGVMNCILCNKVKVGGITQVVCNTCLRQYPSRPPMTKENLTHDYLIRELSLIDLSNKYGYNQSYIWSILVSSGVRLRTPHESHSTRIYTSKVAELCMKKLSPETLEKRSKLTKETLIQDYIVREMSTPNLAEKYGYTASQIWSHLNYHNIPTRTVKQATNTDKNRIRASDTQTKRLSNPTERLRISQTLESRDSGVRDKIGNSVRKFYIKYPKARIHQSKVQKELWSDPEYKTRMVGKLARSHNKAPSNLEKIMMAITERYNLPLRYVGNNGNIVIGGLRPDFISTNGIKLVVLTDGEYWHKDPYREVCTDQIYKESGYKVIHFSGNELKKTERSVIATIIRFEMRKTNETKKANQ